MSPNWAWETQRCGGWRCATPVHYCPLRHPMQPGAWATLASHFVCHCCLDFTRKYDTGILWWLCIFFTQTLWAKHVCMCNSLISGQQEEDLQPTCARTMFHLVLANCSLPQQDSQINRSNYTWISPHNHKSSLSFWNRWFKLVSVNMLRNLVSLLESNPHPWCL